jgi:hypothetical protein
VLLNRLPIILGGIADLGLIGFCCGREKASIDFFLVPASKGASGTGMLALFVSQARHLPKCP